MLKKQYNSNLRTQIYEIIKTAISPISVKEIMDQLSSQFATDVNKTSVYRQLELLQELKQIQSLELSIDKQTRFEISKTPHVHFVCINCETVMCLPEGAVTLNLQNLDKNYQISNYNLEISGVCKLCTN
jgi:Fe2+ or Zn2+ uptake regulation protein